MNENLSNNEGYMDQSTEKLEALAKEYVEFRAKEAIASDITGQFQEVEELFTEEVLQQVQKMKAMEVDAQKYDQITTSIASESIINDRSAELLKNTRITELVEELKLEVMSLKS